MQSLYLSLLSGEFLSQARERENNRVYNKARQKLPLQGVEEFAGNAFAPMTACANGSLPAIGRRAFVFDGTTVRTPHTNQEGASHWPLIRMLVADANFGVFSVAFARWHRMEANQGGPPNKPRIAT